MTAHDILHCGFSRTVWRNFNKILLSTAQDIFTKDKHLLKTTSIEADRQICLISGFHFISGYILQYPMCFMFEAGCTFDSVKFPHIPIPFNSLNCHWMQLSL
jgi:hypothetical protein